MASREESVVGPAAAQLAAAAAKLAAAAAASASSSTSVVVRSTELAVPPDAPPKDYYYPLYRLLLRWKQFALPLSAPHAALLPPPDATTTSPLSHLLASLAGLQRARRARTSGCAACAAGRCCTRRAAAPTGRLAPPDSSWQRPTRAAASWAEWRHYRRVRGGARGGSAHDAPAAPRRRVVGGGGAARSARQPGAVRATAPRLDAWRGAASASAAGRSADGVVPLGHADRKA